MLFKGVKLIIWKSTMPIEIFDVFCYYIYIFLVVIVNQSNLSSIVHSVILKLVWNSRYPKNNSVTFVICIATFIKNCNKITGVFLPWITSYLVFRNNHTLEKCKAIHGGYTHTHTGVSVVSIFCLWTTYLLRMKWSMSYDVGPIGSSFYRFFWGGPILFLNFEYLDWVLLLNFLQKILK